MLPSTWLQVLVVIAVVVPGFTYQIERRRVTGPDPDEVDVSIRILRAITSSAIFASLYAVTIGPFVLNRYDSSLTITSANLRGIGMTVFALVFLIPWAAARTGFYLGTSAWWIERRAQLARWSEKTFKTRNRWDPTPSAWDFAFARDEPGFVRILTTGGLWIGGYWGTMSFASTYPDPPDIYLEIGYEMSKKGVFTGAVSAPEGVYVRCSEVVLVDFIPVNDESVASPGEGTGDSAPLNSDTGSTSLTAEEETL